MASEHDRDYLFLFVLACLHASWTSCASPLRRASLQACDHLCSSFEKDMPPGFVLHTVVCLTRRHYHFQNVSIGMAFALALLQHVDLEILISTDSEILHSRSSKTFLRHRLVACADQKGVTVFRSRCIYVPDLELPVSQRCGASAGLLFVNVSRRICHVLLKSSSGSYRREEA